MASDSDLQGLSNNLMHTLEAKTLLLEIAAAAIRLEKIRISQREYAVWFMQVKLHCL